MNGRIAAFKTKTNRETANRPNGYVSLADSVVPSTGKFRRRITAVHRSDLPCSIDRPCAKRANSPPPSALQSILKCFLQSLLVAPTQLQFRPIMQHDRVFTDK